MKPKPPSLKYFSSYFFAVFNSTDHDRRVVRGAFVDRFGADAYRKSIAPHIRGGVMGVFSAPSTYKLRTFVYALAKQADDRFGKHKERSC